MTRPSGGSQHRYLKPRHWLLPSNALRDSRSSHNFDIVVPTACKRVSLMPGDSIYGPSFCWPSYFIHIFPWDSCPRAARRSCWNCVRRIRATCRRITITIMIMIMITTGTRPLTPISKTAPSAVHPRRDLYPTSSASLRRARYPLSSMLPSKRGLRQFSRSAHINPAAPPSLA